MSSEAERLAALGERLRQAARGPLGPGGQPAAEREILVSLLERLAPGDTAAGSQATSTAATAVTWQEPAGVWSIADARHYLDRHFDQAFSIEFFVDKCAINSGDFSRRFTALAGYPLFEYLNRQRVRRACLLLKSSQLSIIEIASAVGYNNLSFFNRYFLRLMGCTPRAWRQNAG